MPKASRRSFVVEIAVAVFLFTFALRTWGITTRFLLLGDQMRDWDIALRPLTGQPLVGPATHVHGYTIGPAFYWILWLIRVVLGPWFQNLPHAGGIGQALLHSAADALLFVALATRFRSIWIGLATVLLIATAPFDLSLAAIVWNPTMGATLAKAATALVLLDWHRRSTLKAVILFAVAWMAIHAYTGAIYVVVAVFGAALLVDGWDALKGVPSARRIVIRNAAIIAAVIAVLQIPYLVYRFSHPNEPAMAAVTGSVGEILSGKSSLRISESAAGYVKALSGIEFEPWRFESTGLLMLAAGIIVALRYWRDPTVLMMTLVPTSLCIVGYAFFLSGLDNYYYLSLMPAAVMTLVLAATAIPVPRLAQGIAIALVVFALAITPARRRHAMATNQMPEYGAIVHASRVIVDRGTPVRSIRTEFKLPPTNDPEFVYRVLGGKLEPASPWVAVIQLNGDVSYKHLSPM